MSHDTALGVYGIGEFESPRVHLTVPRDFRMRDEALVLHRAELPDEDVVGRPGFRLTTLSRSLVDVACEEADEAQLGRAVAEALESGRLTRRQLRARAEAVDPSAAARIERALTQLKAT